MQITHVDTCDIHPKLLRRIARLSAGKRARKRATSAGKRAISAISGRYGGYEAEAWRKLAEAKRMMAEVWRVYSGCVVHVWRMSGRSRYVT